MNAILIGYDLNKSGQNYDQLLDAIRAQFPNYWHCLDSTWIVKTNATPVEVRDWLQSYIDANDELFVVDITGKAAAWTGFVGNCNDWLKNNL